jgi:hypothetical protein
MMMAELLSGMAAVLKREQASRSWRALPDVFVALFPPWISP